MMNEPIFKGEILLCEDNNMNQEIICGRLAKLGLKTIKAENGKDCIDKVERRIKSGTKPFDLIFMDIYMPVMDGLEAAAKISKLNTGTSIIAMTANNTPAEKEQYKAHGMADCLNKPFTSQELLDCVSKYIKPVNMQAANNPPPDNGDLSQLDQLDDENLKIKLIQSFVRNNKDKYIEITRAVDNGEIELAHRLAHTLKGSAGLLGKMHLHKAAKEVEDLLKNDENHVNKTVMNALKTELNIVLEEFSQFTAKDLNTETEPGLTANIPDNGKINETELLALFEELEALLDGGDIKCLELIDRTSGINLRSILGINEPLIKELIQQIGYFEFDIAMKILIQLKSNLDTNRS
jgi:CheY-like chemotaxis protein